jgi:hypothetical protein
MGSFKGDIICKAWACKGRLEPEYRDGQKADGLAALSD